jgi:hypothetical protein
METKALSRRGLLRDTGFMAIASAISGQGSEVGAHSVDAGVGKVPTAL